MCTQNINLGNKLENIKQAISLLEKDDKIRNINTSTIIETEPVGPVAQDDFLNGVIVLETLFSPEELLEFIHEIETIGKRQRTIHWGPRTIDLDIIFFNQDVIQSKDLIIPHKEMQNRIFVLEPLAEIAPHLIHPILNQTILQLLEERYIIENQ